MSASSSTHSSPAPASYEPAMARHDGLVHAVIRHQYGGSLTYAQLLQSGRIGLWHAIQHFNPNHGTTFSTYAWPSIARQVWHDVAQANSPPQEVLTPNPPLVAPDLNDLAQRGQVYDCLKNLVDKLPAHLRKVVILYYGLYDHPPHSLRQLGRKLGISHEMVRQRLLAALVILRHPANSLPLRQLLDHNTIKDYEYADELAQTFLRRRGGRNGR
ncbi:MAG: sigma-70 family RNA polymerase sigma factor [Chloroflexi bacterium]|nr:sigma-70 family RNA polymerase sigma factor [Chloroflexota bacterium]